MRGDIVLHKKKESPTAKSKKDILYNCLLNRPIGGTTANLAEELGFARPTVAKYLNELFQEGKISKSGVGSYTLFYITKETNRNKSANLIYTKLLELLASQYSAFPVSMGPFEMLLKKVGSTLVHSAGNLLPPLSLPNLRSAPQDAETLRALVEFIPPIFQAFDIEERRAELEVVPPVGEKNVPSILVRLVDDVIIRRRSELHYYVLAGVVEEVLSINTRVLLCFNLREIHAKNASFYFELGFIDRMYMDLSVDLCVDSTLNPRQVLDHIKVYWLVYWPDLKVEEYLDGSTLHFKLIFPSNQRLEEKMRVNLLNWQYFLENYQKYLVPRAPPLKKDPLPGEIADINRPYLVLRVFTNYNKFWDTWVQLSNSYYRELKFHFHYEKVGDQYFTYFYSKEEFNAVYAHRYEPDVERKFYETRVGPLKPEYYLNRNRQIGRLKEIFTQK